MSSDVTTEQFLGPLLRDLNVEQQRAVQTTEGPVLLIAGPGAGKTLTLVRRTLHLITSGLAKPREIVLCTYTEKASLEIRDRMRAGARAIGLTADLSELRTGTIHGICSEFIDRYRHLTPLGNGYEVLDGLTQQLFLLDHFDDILGSADPNGKYLGRWATKWTAISGILPYFDKLTEELVDSSRLEHAADSFLKSVGTAFSAYENKLVEENRTDFAHLQKFFLDLLQDPVAGDEISAAVKYVMVDEYQDTNRIQEQLVTELSRSTGNLCVVGDEDQALYRFRGATVRNILEFPHRFADTTVISLTTNYRSHPKIVDAFDTFMKSSDWSNPAGGPSFRFPKTIGTPKDVVFPDYPAVFSIFGESKKDEAKRFADLVAFLLENQVIEDPSQVALLLRSVRLDHSGPYLEALDSKGIPYFCPRARAFFENEEVWVAITCLAVILDWFGDNRGSIQGQPLLDLAKYVDDSLLDIARTFSDPHPLSKVLQELRAEVETLPTAQSLDRRLADYLFELLSVEPFLSWMDQPNRARNLATLSELINVFQRHYHYSVLTDKNLRSLRLQFFNSFMRLLHEGGMNEYEDPDQPFPKGCVQVMTIHQSKGLEFPVVVVGSLATQVTTGKAVDKDLGPYYSRPAFEPASRITAFDRMRLHYVAFSRPQKILVLSCDQQPKSHFDPIWAGLQQWPYVQKDLLASQGFEYEPKIPPKKSFSFTGDLKVYETCPRQYEMFRHYDFTPSRSAVIFFGLLVHQTIEDVHRMVLAGRLAEVTEEMIGELLEFNFKHLAKKDVRPIGKEAKASALRQVINYVDNYHSQLERVIETEVDVSLEKGDYILAGSVDLLMGDDGALEILDFKSSKRPPAGHPSLGTYYQQLCIYAHILEKRLNRKPDRLLLYWTAEADLSQALMEFPYNAAEVSGAIKHFDSVVQKIQALDFDVKVVPEKSTCKECDFKNFCVAKGTLDRKAVS